jgi:hypothetical protein
MYLRIHSLLTLTALAISLPAQLRADFTPIVGWDKQLFPSILIGSAAVNFEGVEAPENYLGEINGLLGVEIVAPHADAEVEVIIECSDFAEPSRFVGRLEKAGETYSIYPKMKYRFDKLSHCSQATPASITFRVTIDGEETQEQSTTAIFRSINDCPLKVVLGEELLDTSLAFASYVNEQHPFMDKMLREALDIGIVDNFIGYQAGSDEQVLRQVYALWDLLVARDVRYSSITTTAADSSIILSQNVRLLEDTINNQQANCVDGSVLLVSLLRKIDIEAKLILVPGHCYIGFYLDREQTKFVGLETVMVGVDVESKEEIDEVLDRSVDASLRDAKSWPSFLEAIEIGMSNLARDSEKLNDPAADSHRVIDISMARRMGVLPIPHRNSEAFVQFDHSERLVSIDDSADEDDEEDWDEEESEWEEVDVEE